MPLNHRGSETEADSVRLTPDELQALMGDAIRRHGQTERESDPLDRSLATLEDAYEIARQLNIPEEHVRAAVAERQKGKLRDQKRAVVRSRRQARFVIVLGIAVLTAVGAVLAGMNIGLIAVAALFGIGAIFAGIQAKTAPVSNEEADRVELPPQPGACRVCGAPAYNERATFCAQHRFRGPG